MFLQLEAEQELKRRYMQGPLTPALGYDLVLNATNNEALALQTQMQLTLAQMKDPKWQYYLKTIY